MKWLRQAGCLALLILWFAVILLPFGMFRLARQGQIQVRDTRIFHVTERDYQGVGFHTIKQARNEPICQINRVRYLMWEGDGIDSVSCACSDGVERVVDGRRCEANNE